MNREILIVDDEKEITDLIAIYLKNENFIVHKAYDGGSALEILKNEDISLVILDIMLPDIDGFTIANKIREFSNIPIIMLTAKTEEVDKITGLTLGADDYMIKPFKHLELVARVKAQLRRFSDYNKALDNSKDEIVYKDLILYKTKHIVTLQDKNLNLTPTEFEILKMLLENKGNVVNSEEIFEKVWKEKYYTNSNNTITVHIRHLREKMDDLGEKPEYIKTVWGVGYKVE